MKKTITKLTNVLVIALVLSMLLTTTVFAEVKTVEVKGYLEFVELTPEELEQSTSHFSISNVKELLGTVDFYGEEINLYETNGPTTISLLAENGIIFEAYKVNVETTEENNIFNITDEAIGVSSGEVIVWVPDETGKLDEYGYPEYVEKTIPATELSNYEVEMPTYVPGCTISLTEPGYYYVLYRVPAAAGAAHAYVKVSAETVEEEVVEEPITEEPVAEEPVADEKVSALPTSSKVLVNGTDVSFEAYNINGNNYFKLRDIALSVNGTEKQFGVEWDTEKQAINLTSNSSYESVGGEMATGDGTTKEGTLNKAPIYKDGVEVQLTAYNINGNNYFKLRDLAQAFNIGITWDGTTNTVGIDTSIDYAE